VTRTMAADGPLRVLKIVPTLRCGGTEGQFMALSGGLRERGVEVGVACLRRGGPFAEEAVRRGLPVREYPIGPFRSAHTLALQTRLARDLVRERVDIVHAYNFYGNVFAVPPARLAGTPVVLAAIRDCGPYLTPMQLRVQRLVCRAATCVVVNAGAVRDWLIGSGYEADRIVVIPNGVDMRRFAGPVDPLALRAELGLTSGTPLVTVVSRLVDLKGLDSFMGAAARLALRYPSARFLIAGERAHDDTGYAASLARMAARLGIGDRVMFTGLRADVPALLASSTVAVMPSLNEALSNVLLESMAAGAPTVATRVGGTPEAITDGVSGLLVAPGDPEALAVAVGRLLEDATLAHRLGRAARQVVEQRFTLERMVDDTERLYASLRERNRARRRVA
jgi:L-malate glycosyltransferase